MIKHLIYCLYVHDEVFVNDRISGEASSIAVASKTLNPNVNVKGLSLVIASNTHTSYIADYTLEGVLICS